MDANFRKIPSNLAFRFIASNQMKRNKQVFFFFSIIVIIIMAIPCLVLKAHQLDRG